MQDVITCYSGPVHIKVYYQAAAVSTRTHMSATVEHCSVFAMTMTHFVALMCVCPHAGTELHCPLLISLIDQALSQHGSTIMSPGLCRQGVMCMLVISNFLNLSSSLSVSLSSHRPAHTLSLKLLLCYVQEDDVILNDQTPSFKLRLWCVQEDDVILCENSIDFAMKSKNPLDNVHFFDNFDSQHKYSMLKNTVSPMYPDIFQASMHASQHDMHACMPLWACIGSLQNVPLACACDCSVTAGENTLDRHRAQTNIKMHSHVQSAYQSIIGSDSLWECNCTVTLYRPNVNRPVRGLVCHVTVMLRKPMLHTGAQAEGIQ